MQPLLRRSEVAREQPQQLRETLIKFSIFH
jgi:hypothetical protein